MKNMKRTIYPGGIIKDGTGQIAFFRIIFSEEKLYAFKVRDYNFHEMTIKISLKLSK